jgi:hypothetical protein
MKLARARRGGAEVLLHDVLFGAFLLVCWLRFGAHLGFLSPHSLLYLALLALEVGLIAWCSRRPTDLRWRVRLAYYPLAMNVPYVHLSTVLPKIGAPLWDALLLRVDTRLFGTTPSLWMQAWIHPLLTEVLSLCYMLFIPYLFLSMFWYWIGPVPLLKRFYTGLFSAYAVGFFGYSLVPAGGPYLAMADQFSVPLTGWWFTRWSSDMVTLGSNGVDIFPSLHWAASALILFSDRRHLPWRFRLYLLPCMGLWLSTLYLRYHYLIDCVLGLLLAALAFRLAGLDRPAEFHQPRPLTGDTASPSMGPGVPADTPPRDHRLRA